ncbi:MAG: flagellar biosynthesis protein FlgD [Caulobacter sp.]|nr:flagellar biosynthesis protein FlgD [Caulobacter sp.]
MVASTGNAAFDAINAAKYASSGGSSINDRLASSSSSIAANQQQFLQLLTTQLKNQDPLSPTDTTQMTQQITQMSGVEQQLLTNDLLKTLVGLSDAGLSSAVNMIGKQATASSDSSVLHSGSAKWTYNLPRTATAVKIEVQDKFGKTIATLKPEDLSSGNHDLVWDGKADNNGTEQPDGGAYTLKITATDANGGAIAASSVGQLEGIVTAVTSEGGVSMATIDGVKTPLSWITGVSSAPTVPAS